MNKIIGISAYYQISINNMAADLEPIDIDINLRQNVSEQSDTASQGMNDITKAAESMQAEIGRLNKVIDNMNIVIAEQKKQLESSNEVSADAVSRLNEMQAALDKARAEMSAYAESCEKMGKAAKEGADVSSVMNDVHESLADTEAGLKENMEELIQNQEKVNGKLDESNSKTKVYSASNQILSHAIGQAATALGIENTAVVSSISNVRVITAAKRAWTTAVTILNTQLGLSVVASKALLISGIGALLVGIGLIIAAIKSWNDNTQDLNESMEKFNNDTASGAAKQRAEFERLRQQWILANGDLKKQEQLVRENIDAYNGFGAEINNVTDAERMFVDNADSFVMSMTKRAMATAAMDLASEKYKEAIQKMMDAENLRNNPTEAASFTQKAGSILLSILPGRTRQSALSDILNDEIDTLESDSKKAQRRAVGYAAAALGIDEESTKILQDLGFDATNKIKENSKRHYQQIKEYNQKLIDNMTSDELSSDAGKQVIKARDEAAKKLQAWDSKYTQKLESEARRKEAKEKKANDDLSKKQISYQDKIDAARLAAMKDGAEKQRSAALAEFDSTKRMIEQERKELDEIEKITGKPATEQRNALDALEKASEDKYKKELEDVFNMELQYMHDYIQEYGTFQQKKLSIAQEYDKKIAESQNEWDKKSLEAQKKRAMSAVDFDAINKRIDWQGVFGNMTGMLDSQLKETLSGLKEYIKTDQFKASSDTDKKTVYDAIAQLRSVIPGGQGTLDFNAIRRQMDDLGVAINDLQTATLNEKTAYENLDKAQKKYDDALKSGSQTLIDSAKQSLDAAKNSAGEASDAYKNAESNVQGLGNSFKETATDTIDGLNSVADGLNSFSSNSLPQIFKGLQNTVTGLSKLNIGGKVGEAVGTLSKTLSSAGFIGQIISAVLSILDILKEGVGTLVANLIDTILNAVDGILKNLLSGKLFAQIFESLKNGIGNILNTISFGGFNSLMGSINGSNAKETAETISRLTTSNEALKVSVDALKEEMAGANGAKSIKAYNEAVNAQKRYNENLRNILDAQMGYHGSHHSNAYYWNLDANSLNEVNRLLGTSLNNAWSDFSRLSADQMNEIRKHLPDIWSEMINQGKYGDRFKDDWNNYADQAGKVLSLTEELRENIAQISFDNLRDSFVSTLMDMDADAQDFAGNFEEYMTRALLNFAIGDLLDDDLKKWYESWTDSMNSQAGKLTEEQIEQYKKQWDDMVQQGLDKRDEIASLTGYTGNNSGRTGSTGGIASMSQDSANELNGNFYALRQQVGDIRNLQKEADTQRKSMLTFLSRIVENTEYCRLLENVKNSLEDMQTRGIKVKV